MALQAAARVLTRKRNAYELRAKICHAMLLMLRDIAARHEHVERCYMR